MPTDPLPRRARLVLCGRDGAVIGALPPMPVSTPWWQEAEAVVDAARAAYAQEIVVLRMLDSELPRPHGGLVTYLAEVGALSSGAHEAIEPYGLPLDEQPLRATWARPGGPAADLAWAEGILWARRLERSGPPVQVRTWNLSSIWRLPLADGTSAWLKIVPPFFAHEGAMLRKLGSGPVPQLLGHDGPRLLLAEIEGEDLYDAAEPVLELMIDALVLLQAEWIGRTHELLMMQVPDWRADVLATAIADLVARRHRELSRADAETLDAFVAGLPSRFADVAACGIPDALVHGDFHPGNVRGTAARLTLLDWGDCGIGHPLLDMPAFLAAVPADDVAAVRRHWLATWSANLPAADAETAARLLEPVAAARQAVIYQGFVDRIEPVERRHHDADVVDWLGRTAAVVRG